MTSRKLISEPGIHTGVIHFYAVRLCERGDLLANAVLPGKGVEICRFAVPRPIARGIDEVRLPLPGKPVAVTVGGVKRPGIVKSGDLQDFDAERFDDRSRIAIEDLPRAARELNAVAVHDERRRRAVGGGAVEAVEGLAGDPAGITDVRHDPGTIAESGLHAQRLTDGDRNHDTEAAAVELGAARQPRDVSRDIDATPELVDDGGGVDESEGCEGRVVTDTRVGVLDRVLDALVVGD